MLYRGRHKTTHSLSESVSQFPQLKFPWFRPLCVCVLCFLQLETAEDVHVLVHPGTYAVTAGEWGTESQQTHLVHVASGQSVSVDFVMWRLQSAPIARRCQSVPTLGCDCLAVLLSTNAAVWLDAGCVMWLSEPRAACDTIVNFVCVYELQ